MNNSTLKQGNRNNVLKLVATGKAKSRIELAALTGLTKMSITNIVDGLIEDQLIEEKAIQKSDAVGRPRKSLSIGRKAPKLISVFVSNNSIAVTMTDFKLAVLKAKRSELPSGSATLEAITLIQDSLDEFLRSAINENLYGIGISISPDCTFDQSRIHENLSLRYNLPIYIDSSDVCSLICESYYGECVDDNEALFINIGNDVTSAGKSASFGTSGFFQPNFGHISIDYNGLACNCGNKGCINTYISSKSMEKKLKEITKMKVDFKGFCELQTKKNDSRMDWAMKDMTDKLAVAIINYSNLFAPTKVLIAGDGFYLPERYLLKLEKTVNDKKINPQEYSVQIRKPFFKNDGQILGGSALLLTHLFESF